MVLSHVILSQFLKTVPKNKKAGAAICSGVILILMQNFNQQLQERP